MKEIKEEEDECYVGERKKEEKKSDLVTTLEVIGAIYLQ